MKIQARVGRSVLLVLVAAMGALPAALAKDPDMGVVTEVKEAGPHGGTVLDTKKSRVEVLFDRKSEKVHVFLLKQEKKEIEPLSLTLLGDSEEQKVIGLEAIAHDGSVPHYEGTLGTQVKPVVGISIHFKLPGGKKADLRAPKFPLERR